MKKFLSLMVLVTLGLPNPLNAAENPYQIIVERNAFRLNPPPTNNINAIPTPPPEPPPNIKITGITSLGGERKAWFIVTGPKPGDKPEYIDLLEGQRRGALELIQILEGPGEVKVVNGGKEMLLSFKDHGNKPSAATGNMPGIQPMGQTPGQPLGIPSPNPPSIPGNANLGNPRGGVSTIANTRPISPGFNNNAPTPQQISSIPSPANENVRSIPRTMRTPSAGGNFNPPSGIPAANNGLPQNNVSQEEALIHHEIQRHANENNPDYPPLPPP